MPVCDPLKIKQIDIVKNDIEIIKQEIETLKTQLKKINITLKALDIIQNDKINETKGGWWW
jgi:chaperonin cofactor prefoldin